MMSESFVMVFFKGRSLYTKYPHNFKRKGHCFYNSPPTLNQNISESVSRVLSMAAVATRPLFIWEGHHWPPRADYPNNGPERGPLGLVIPWLFLFALALGGVYRACMGYPRSGALLPHRFTLTCAPAKGPSAVCFLLHWPSHCCAQNFSGAVLS